jgi:hypothetical protein
MSLLLLSSTLGLLGYRAFLLDLRTSSNSSLYGLSYPNSGYTHMMSSHYQILKIYFWAYLVDIQKCCGIPQDPNPTQKNITLPWLVSSLEWCHLQNLKRHSFDTPPGCSKFKTVVASPAPPKQILPPSFSEGGK